MTGFDRLLRHADGTADIKSLYIVQ